MSKLSNIVSVYADGGCILANPSPYGGTWAYLYLDDREIVICPNSGIVAVVPDDKILFQITNNQSELFAVAKAISGLPDGWTGTIFTDSLCTIERMQVIPSIQEVINVPYSWLRSIRKNLLRLGHIEYVLLDGHPNKKQLKSGIGKRGNPCSKYNVMCDKMCKRVAAEYCRYYGINQEEDGEE